MSEPHTDESSRSDLELGPDEQFLFGEPDPVELHLPEKLHIGESDTDEAITEKLRRQGVHLGKGLIAPRVFWPALIVIVGIVVLSVAIPEGTGNVILNIQNWIVDNLGWYYMLVVGLFVAFAIVIGFSKFGKIRLGKDDDKPEFGVLSWFAMLFAAGMGIGLVFYGVAEPLTYATTGPKPGWAGGEVENAQMGMAQTFVHWGLHPWALYAVLGMALAYAIHRRGRPLSIRWALEPLLGNRVKGWAGDLIDVIAIFGTVFGIATSLGLGVQQISAGLKHIGVVGDYDNTFLIILIVRPQPGIQFLQNSYQIIRTLRYVFQRGKDGAEQLSLQQFIGLYIDTIILLDILHQTQSLLTTSRRDILMIQNGKHIPIIIPKASFPVRPRLITPVLLQG